jgi:methyl-accepting chemotaxis protein
MRAKLILGFLLVVLAEVVVNAFFSFAVKDPLQNLIYTAVIGMIVGGGIGVYLSARLTRDLTGLSSLAREISEGDLTKDVTVPGNDEISQLGSSFRKMVQQLRGLVGEVKGTAAGVSQSAHGLSASAREMSASAQEIASANEHVAKSAEYQAEFVEKSSERIRGMAASIELIATRAQEASRASAEAGYTAQHGGEATGSALENMSDVFQRMETAAAAVEGFGERFQKIEKIVEVITGISQQTNLLALNATIEAARAGDYGRGFAVVAEEVRKLSEKARKSAGDIADVIREIGHESHKVVTTMSQANAGIRSGREVVDTVGRSLKEIITATVEAAAKVKEISTLAQEQTRGAEEMVKTMEEISKIAEDNAAATEEASAATEQLTAAMDEMAQSASDLQKSSADLIESISRFKI